MQLGLKTRDECINLIHVTQNKVHSRARVNMCWAKLLPHSWNHFGLLFAPV